MSSIKILLTTGSLALLLIITAAFINHRNRSIIKNSTKEGSKGFAVVELFTSEGCSSCPPADDLVAAVQKEYNNKQIYILAFHVDYWDRQGWRDIFSDVRYSERQRQYGNLFNMNTIYTPQIVVNGKTEFVGSDQRRLLGAISSGLQEEPIRTLSFDVAQEKDQVIVNYQVDKADENTEVVMALVQKSARNKVMAGENSGATLSHVQIVRNLIIRPLDTDKTGKINIALPDGFNKTDDWELIGLLQSKTDGSILAASRSDFHPAKS